MYKSCTYMYLTLHEFGLTCVLLQVEDKLKQDLTDALRGQYGESNQPGITKSYDLLQETVRIIGHQLPFYSQHC